VEVTGIVHWPLPGARIETVSGNNPSSFFLLALSQLLTKLSRYGADDVEGVIEGS
jgi:chemotaxis receptor (MCP) glutamine deamidase CheD